MKLFGIYNVISNKTVRAHENFFRKYRKKNPNVLGQLIKTNRGYFINGYNVDVASMLMWHRYNNDADKALEVREAYEAAQREAEVTLKSICE